MRAKSLLMVPTDSSWSVISFSHFLQFCTYSWLPRLCLLCTGQQNSQNITHTKLNQLLSRSC